MTSHAHDDEHAPAEPVCQHRTFYWINRARLNWRCTDACGFQYFGTVTQARREARAAQREARRVAPAGGRP